MGTSELRAYSTVCRCCGVINSITAVDVAEDTRVGCSRCKALLGVWSEIKSAARKKEPLHAAVGE
jgi:hypothetical protein